MIGSLILIGQSLLMLHAFWKIKGVEELIVFELFE